MPVQQSISRPFSVLFTLLFMLALTFGALNTTPAYAAGILYATPGGTGNCSSWVNACALQTALTGATSGNEIWTAAGTHKPTTMGTYRDATFQLKDGVALYGGFAGTETTRDQRDPATNVTILSGDIDNNDSQTPIITELATVTGNTTNSYHVVTGTSGATLDGFTITAGNANGGDSYTNGSGGGMYNSTFANPTLTNITFSGNKATVWGGGMFNWDNSPTLTNITFSGNRATHGGGMFNLDSWGIPTLTNVTFSGNMASYNGGGMFNSSSSPTLTNVTFSGNFADAGGGMLNSNSSSPTLTNVTFSQNMARVVGGMFNDSSSSPLVRNTIFWGNTGAQIYNTTTSSPVVSDSVVQGGCPARSICTHIVTADPLLGVLGDYGGFCQTSPLLPGSSAIDEGNDGVCPANDQRGVTRPQGAHCDIGAYELVQLLTNRVYLPLVAR